MTRIAIKTPTPIEELIQRLEAYPSGQRVLLITEFIGYSWSDDLWGDLEALMERFEGESP